MHFPSELSSIALRDNASGWFWAEGNLVKDINRALKFASLAEAHRHYCSHSLADASVVILTQDVCCIAPIFSRDVVPTADAVAALIPESTGH